MKKIVTTLIIAIIGLQSVGNVQASIGNDVNTQKVMSIKEKIEKRRESIRNMLKVYAKKRLTVELEGNEIIIKNIDKAITLKHNDTELALSFLKQYILKNNFPELTKKLNSKINGSIYFSEKQGKVVGDFKENNDDDLDIILRHQIKKLYDEEHFADYHYSEVVNMNKDKMFGLIIDLNDIKNINLFSNQLQLDEYLKNNSIISHKERKMKGKAYRVFNISTGYKEIGGIRVLKPGETFSTDEEIKYDEELPADQRKYKNGSMLLGGKEVTAYGGGLCGVSTGIYQSILTNKGLSILEQTAHSGYVHSLYDTKINGVTVKTPGLDSTIVPDYFGKGKHLKNLVFKNVSKEPIVVGLLIKDGFDYGLTLGNGTNKGEFKFMGNFKSRGTTCYTWKINGVNKNSCYYAVN